MARRNRPGQISLDNIELEGGIVVHVVLNKETGVFRADYYERHVGENMEAHCGEHWEGKDLEKIREDVQKWGREQKALKWEPVIAIGPVDAFGMHQAHKVLGQKFERLMRAKKFNGDEYEWRYWAYTKPQKDGNVFSSFVSDADLEVYPPAGTTSQPSSQGSGQVEPVIIEYTPERWLALLQLFEMEKALRDRLHEIVGVGPQKMTEFLAQVPKLGLLGLAPNGPGKQKGKKVKHGAP